MSQARPGPEGVDPAALKEQLLDLWTRKELEALRIVAQQSFSSLGQPLEGLLELLEGCPGRQKGRGFTLGQCILQEFERWRRQHPQVTLRAVPEDQAVGLQRRALGLLTDAQPGFMDPLLELYQLGSLDGGLLRLHVSTLQAQSCYREAALLSCKLKLQHELDMEEVCVPLILQDKLPVAESWVKGHPDLEKRLVTLLDSWCQPSFSIAQLKRQFPRLNLTRHQTDQIQPKMLSKQVFRLMDKFSIDPALCPNSTYKRKLDSLRFLMYKRFVEKGMSEENWNDHVQSTVAGCPELQVQLVELVVKYGGLRSAAQWSLQYAVPRDRLPFGVWDTQQSLPASLRTVCGGVSSQNEAWDPPQPHRDRFYQLPITREHVHFLDTLEGLQRCKDAVIQPGCVVGLDMEWRAGFGTVTTQRVTLIQLAVQGHVFLLDLSAEGFCQHTELVQFIRTLFSDPKVLKLGYGMSGDLRYLLATWPQFSEEPLKTEGMLDLLIVHQQIQRSGRGRGGASHGVLVGEGPAEKGLSLLVQQILGKPLDKMEQLSNWEKRPLRISQLRYAAADAYCLLEVYFALSKDPASFGLPADLRSVSSTQQEKKTKEDRKEREKAKQTRRREERQGTRGPAQAAGPEKSTVAGKAQECAGPPVSPQQLKVVCDNMLQGLGRYLRCLGVDVRMLENTDDHRVAAQIAQTEGRVILTCGQPFQSLKSQVGEGRCLELECSEKARDQAVRVLRHFNVQPTKSDIFSRCQVCNSDEYMKMTRGEMEHLLRERGFFQGQDAGKQEEESWEQEEEVVGRDPLTPAAPDPPRYSPQCRWAPSSHLDPSTLTFPGGAALQLHTVPPGLLPRIPQFYICTGCGKVFWEGSHFSRVISQFQEVLRLPEEEEGQGSRYQAASQAASQAAPELM